MTTLEAVPNLSDLTPDEGPAIVLRPVASVERVDRSEAFWTQRPELETIRDYARARLASPWAVLGVVLARVAATVPPHITLPPTIGGKASLNLFVAVVGASGLGKGAASAVAAEAVLLGAGNAIPVKPLGSGEGMVRAIAHREPELLPDGSSGPMRTVVDEERVIFETSEVDQLAALAGRQGATLMSQVRSLFSGEPLGHSYAASEKAVVVPAHAYRACLIVGVQPRRAGALLDDADGGTPQRFVWMPAIDPHADGAQRETPAPYVLPSIDWDVAPRHLRIPAAAVRLVRESRVVALQGGTPALDGHEMLTRLKIAAALAVLAGRDGVNADDWRLSEQVMRKSREAREACVEALAELDVESATRRGETRAVQDDAQVVAAERIRLERLENRILRYLEEGGSTTRGALNKKLRSGEREYLDQVLERLVETGRIASTEQDEYRTA